MFNIYLTELDFSLSQCVFDKLLSLVCDDKKQQVLRYHRREDSLRCLFGELLLLYGLRKEYGITQYELSINPYGKPYLKSCENIYFSKTHAGHRVGCVIGNAEMGLDIEQILPLEYLRDMESLSNIFMNETEREGIESLLPTEKMQEYFRYWTRKEALVKCIGCGIGILKGGKIVSPNAHRESIFEVPLNITTWRLDPEYYMSLSSFQAISEPGIINVFIEELISMLLRP